MSKSTFAALSRPRSSSTSICGSVVVSEILCMLWKWFCRFVSASFCSQSALEVASWLLRAGCLCKLQSRNPYVSHQKRRRGTSKAVSIHSFTASPITYFFFLLVLTPPAQEVCGLTASHSQLLFNTRTFSCLPDIEIDPRSKRSCAQKSCGCQPPPGSAAACTGHDTMLARNEYYTSLPTDDGDLANTLLVETTLYQASWGPGIR